uniref:Uncharacterized protein n=1 Tax=virus sp. ctqq75 TaxID=2827999 RepID=A0A8S5RFA6_9VIRU|nr:MAG TPA: hypothetical protein [virus sp. ctqq75]
MVSSGVSNRKLNFKVANCSTYNHNAIVPYK